MQNASKTLNDRNSKLKKLNYSSNLNKDSGNFLSSSNDKDFEQVVNTTSPNAGDIYSTSNQFANDAVSSE